MAIWAIADLHLSFGVPSKGMELFGSHWENHGEKIAHQWKELISKDDLVLIAGDISWAMRLEQAKVDLDWIGRLPGTKVMIRGNHDYWWDSLKKMRAVADPSIHFIHNNIFNWNNITIGGARLWDSPEYHFGSYIEMKENEKSTEKLTVENKQEESEKIFLRELDRLELSLKEFNPLAKKRIVMTHYPPIGADLQPSRVSSLLERYHTDICLFGHLHNIKKGVALFDKSARGVHYMLTACDYLNFTPIEISI